MVMGKVWYVDKKERVRCEPMMNGDGYYCHVLKKRARISVGKFQGLVMNGKEVDLPSDPIRFSSDGVCDVQEIDGKKVLDCGTYHYFENNSRS